MWVPRTCPVCRRVGPAPCDRCVAALVPPPPLAPPPGLARCPALFAYEGVGATLVRRLKYDNHRDAVADLAAAIASQAAPDVDLVTWVPASRRRARRRGFDQGEVLGRAVARSLGVASRRLLVRVGGAGQTGAGRAERLDGPGLVLRDRGALVDDAVVLVVDDVRTTGASLAAAARALRAGGAVRVDGATLAATPIGAPISGATMPRSNAGDREGSGRADPCERETHQRLGT